MIALKILTGPKLSTDASGWDHNAYTVRLSRGEFGVDYAEMDSPWMQGIGITEDPTAEDVLASLMMDASSHVNARTFEEWAEDYGYDTDSRKAFALYETTGRLTKSLRAFLGADFDTTSTEDAEDAARRLVRGEVTA